MFCHPDIFRPCVTCVQLYLSCSAIVDKCHVIFLLRMKYSMIVIKYAANNRMATDLYSKHLLGSTPVLVAVLT